MDILSKGGDELFRTHEINNCAAREETEFAGTPSNENEGNARPFDVRHRTFLQAQPGGSNTFLHRSVISVKLCEQECVFCIIKYCFLDKTLSNLTLQRFYTSNISYIKTSEWLL
jgi:hypothetical protein